MVQLTLQYILLPLLASTSVLAAPKDGETSALKPSSSEHKSNASAFRDSKVKDPPIVFPNVANECALADPYKYRGAYEQGPRVCENHNTFSMWCRDERNRPVISYDHQCPDNTFCITVEKGSGRLPKVIDPQTAPKGTPIEVACIPIAGTDSIDQRANTDDTYQSKVFPSVATDKKFYGKLVLKGPTADIQVALQWRYGLGNNTFTNGGSKIIPKGDKADIHIYDWDFNLNSGPLLGFQGLAHYYKPHLHNLTVDAYFGFANLLP